MLSLRCGLLICVGVLIGGCDLSDAIPAPRLKLSAPQSGSEIPALWRPRGIFVGPAGEVYVAESGSGRVRALEGGLVRVVQDTATAENKAWSRPSAMWGQGLVDVGDGALLLLTPGQPPVVLSASGDAPPQTIGVVRGAGGAKVGARLGALDLRRISGVAPLEGGDLLLALDNQVWLVQRNGALEDAVLTKHLAGNGARGQGPDDAPDATQIPLNLSSWCGLEAHPEGGFFFADGRERLRLVTPGGRALVVTGQGDVRHARPEGLDLTEFGARFDDVTIARWHPTEGVLYFVDGLWVMRLRLDTPLAELDATSAAAPAGRVTYAASRLPESSDFALLDDKALFSAGFSGSLWTTSLDGLDTYETLYGPDPIDEALGQLNGDRYNLNPEEPYASRHAPFAMTEPLLPQALALWGEVALIVSNPLARALQAVDITQPQWAAREFVYNPTSHSLGWPFLAQDPAHPERIYVSDLNTLQAWAQTGDGLAALNLLSFTAPPPNGIPGPALDALLSQHARLEANHARIGLLNPNATVTALEFKNQQLNQVWGLGIGGLPQRGTRSIFSWDLTGAQVWDTSASGDQYAFALPAPSAWDNAEGQILALAHAGGSTAPSVWVGGLEVEVKLAAHIAGGGAVNVAAAAPSGGLPAHDALLRNITALDLLEGFGADPTANAQSLLFAVPDERGNDTTSSRLFFLDGGPDGATPTIHDLDGCNGDLVPEITWIKALAFAPGSPQPVAMIAADGSTLWGCASEPGWAVGGTALADRWTIIKGPIHPGFPPAFAQDARAVVLVGGLAPHEVQVIPVVGPQKPSTLSTTQTYPAPDADRWTAIATPPDASLLIAQSLDPTTQTITLQAARLGDGTLLGDVQATLPDTERIAGGGQGLGDGGIVSALAPGRRLSGLTVAPDGGVYIAMSDTQTLWYLPTLRLDDAAATDRAVLLAVKGPIFENGGDLYPLAANDFGVFVGASAQIYFVDRQTKAVTRVAGGGDQAPLEGLDANAASLGEVQGLAALNGNVYAVTTRELIELRPDKTLGLLSTDGLIFLADGSTLRLGFEVMGSPPLIPWPPSSLLMASAHTHGIVHIPVPAVRLTGARE